MSDLIIKQRTESDELKLFRSLKIRGKLSEEELIYYWNLEKGFNGELMFDEYLKTLKNDFLIINDITFKHNNSTFQIDSLLISQQRCYIFEIKDFEGDYILDEGRFCSVKGKERKDPLSQLNRSESLLRQLFEKFGIKYQIEGYLVFVNPEFYLYNTPINPHVIFPNQLNRFIKKLNSVKSKLNQNHRKIAEKLLQISLDKSPYSQVPAYTYYDLKKGTTCVKCNAFVTSIDGRFIKCDCCGHKESLHSVVLRSVGERSLLFPDRIISVNEIMVWCNLNIHRITIKRILLSEYNPVGKGKATHYVLKNDND